MSIFAVFLLNEVVLFFPCYFHLSLSLSVARQSSQAPLIPNEPDQPKVLQVKVLHHNSSTKLAAWTLYILSLLYCFCSFSVCLVIYLSQPLSTGLFYLSFSIYLFASHFLFVWQCACLHFSFYFYLSSALSIFWCLYICIYCVCFSSWLFNLCYMHQSSCLHL